MPQFEYGDRDAVSPNQLLREIDGHFDRFVTVEVQQDGLERGREIDANLLRTVFATRVSFSEVLRSHVTDIDWQSDTPLSPEEFHQLCDRIRQFSDGYCREHHSRLWEEAATKGTCVNALAGKEIFGDEGIEQRHMSMLWRFGNWLSGLYLHESKTAEELEIDERIESFAALSGISSLVVRCIAAEEQESSLGKQLLHSFFKLAHADVPSSAIHRFAQDVDTETQSVSAMATPIELQRLIERVIRKHFPDCWMENITKEVARVAKIGPKEEQIIKLLPIEHFYFQPTIGESPENDRLPVEGNIHYGERQFHNASLFNNIGEKVFWGDLIDEEVSQICGPYYVLSQGDSYSNVPKWAITTAEALMPASDVNRPKGLPDFLFAPDKRLLRLAYIKAVAMGKIENGRFTRNPTEIEWPEANDE